MPPSLCTWEGPPPAHGRIPTGGGFAYPCFPLAVAVVAAEAGTAGPGSFLLAPIIEGHMVPNRGTPVAQFRIRRESSSFARSAYSEGRSLPDSWTMIQRCKEHNATNHKDPNTSRYNPMLTLKIRGCARGIPQTFQGKKGKEGLGWGKHGCPFILGTLLPHCLACFGGGGWVGRSMASPAPFITETLLPNCLACFGGGGARPGGNTQCLWH